ncbi:MAG: hypothetical protein RBU36_16255, partial [Thermoanaerobaculia bacterium]|nr:hypothetical protein [Thermoanaerobaculia bacterium]
MRENGTREDDQPSEPMLAPHLDAALDDDRLVLVRCVVRIEDGPVRQQGSGDDSHDRGSLPDGTEIVRRLDPERDLASRRRTWRNGELRRELFPASRREGSRIVVAVEGHLSDEPRMPQLGQQRKRLAGDGHRTGRRRTEPYERRSGRGQDEAAYGAAAPAGEVGRLDPNDDAALLRRGRKEIRPRIVGRQLRRLGNRRDEHVIHEEPNLLNGAVVGDVGT